MILNSLYILVLRTSSYDCVIYAHDDDINDTEYGGLFVGGIFFREYDRKYVL